MKHNYLKHLFTVLLLLCSTVATAHDFEVDGIYYNILSETDKTVAVTFRGTYFDDYSNEYTGGVVIPQSVTYNGSTYSVTSIGSFAFNDCSGLKSIEIPNSVTSIGSSAFAGCTGLTSITIPNSVTSIGSSAFAGCTGLISITIPNSVTSIGDNAFSDCTGLTSITIPSSVTSIGWGEFRGCTSLTSIVVDGNNTKYDSRENCNAIIETETNTLVSGCKNTIISSSVTSIGDNAFSDCTGLTSITIPSSVTSIGISAFDHCTGLTSITIPNSVTSIGISAFFGCTGLTSIEIPKSVTSIGEQTFSNCTGLTSITIPNSVTFIGNAAFYDCYGITSITSLIPADKLFITFHETFYGINKTYCTLYVPYGAKETYATTEGWNEFTNIVELATSEVTVTINQYGNATYCSEHALDFSEVEGLKAYNAIGYKPSTQTVTLARVMTTSAGQGVFIKGEPGEYTVPIIDNFDEYTLNLFVGTLEETTVNSTDGEMSNYKFTVADGDETPMFYPFEDNTAFSAGKAYLQIPTAWLPTTAQKSLNIRFDDGETTDIDELKGESGEVKTIYDLQGRVVENPTNGIYIIDGKKVIIK